MPQFPPLGRQGRQDPSLRILAVRVQPGLFCRCKWVPCGRVCGCCRARGIGSGMGLCKEVQGAVASTPPHGHLRLHQEGRVPPEAKSSLPPQRPAPSPVGWIPA